MKQFKKYLLCLLLTFFAVPLLVSAETTQKMYIDITIEEDGAILVREMDVLSGEYNGQRRQLFFANNRNNGALGWNPESSSLYNGSGIQDLLVGDISSNSTFSSFDLANKDYSQVSYAEKGNRGVYTLSNLGAGVELMIFNPSTTGRAFYFEYRVSDVVLVHEDTAELAWTLLDSYQENIKDFKVQIHLPGSDPDLRIWGHGVLNGEVRRESDSLATLSVEDLGANNNTNFRIMFDKDLVPLATKRSYVSAKDRILAYEQEQADLANQERERIKRQNLYLDIATLAVLVVLVTILLVTYFKYDREEKVSFDMEYYRDFPATYGPEILQYLIKKNVNEDGFSASILNLVCKRVLKMEPDANDKKNCTFTYLPQDEDILTASEGKVVNLLIHVIGDGTKVDLQSIKKYGKKVSQAKIFVEEYQDWVNEAKGEGEAQQFYRKVGGKRVIPILLSLLLTFLGFLHFIFESHMILGIVAILLAFASLIYAITFQKRTASGALQYKQWMAFKHFLEDFSRFDEKELPEVTLWEKYLVYATVLGCAKELEKTMRLRIPQNVETGVNSYGMSDIYLWHMMVNMNLASTINSTVHTAVSASRSSIAASSSSSGGGFGGGFSSGGGGFGGGGGGGRF